jgi:hypothetical protein
MGKREDIQAAIDTIWSRLNWLATPEGPEFWSYVVDALEREVAEVVEIEGQQ